MKKYDLIVIGAGSAGLTAVTTAQRRGLKVALLEKNKIGGECTHTGCIPSKAFLYSSKMFHATKNLKNNYGLDGLKISGKANFKAVMQQVDGIVQSIYKSETPAVFEKQGIRVFVHKSGAQFLDKNSVQIGKEILQFKNSLICTGSSPRVVETDGSGDIDFLDNENFWSLSKMPESVLFIGGGIVSAELGQALARFGCRVSILDRNPEILAPVDKDAKEIIVEIFKKEGINIICSAELKNLRKGKNKITATYSQNGKMKIISAGRIFAAAGRQPNISGMNLVKAGIEFTEKGIIINSFLQTSNPNIYACGDVAFTQKFTHAASYEATNAIDNITGKTKRKNDLFPLPWVIFTEPEIAHTGLTEKEAKEKYGDAVSVFKVNADFDRFVTDRNATGYLKVILNSKNLVVGADAIGAHAGEWIQLLTVAIKNKIPAERFADTIFAYPTYSEIVKKAFTRFLRSQK